MQNPPPMRLDQYTTDSYSPGAPLWRQLLWFFVGQPLLWAYWLPLSGVKVALLRAFGAKVGQGVRIKPGVQVKFPWRLTIGDHVWIGEDAWIDNLDEVTIESHVCISQGVYLCTGNHDWGHPHFALRTSPIHLEAGCWLAAKSVVGPGVTIGKGAILSMGSVTGKTLLPMTIYVGNPAQPVKPRVTTLQPKI